MSLQVVQALASAKHPFAFELSSRPLERSPNHATAAASSRSTSAASSRPTRYPRCARSSKLSKMPQRFEMELRGVHLDKRRTSNGAGRTTATRGHAYFAHK